MNQSKQVKKSSTKSQSRKTGNHGLSGKEKILIGIVAAIVVLISAVVIWDNHHPKLILKVDDEKLYLEDMMYDIYNTELSYNYMAQLYQQMGSTEDYWNMQQQNGQTTKEMARNDCLESAKKQVVLYKEAVANGYKVTKEDTKGAKKDAKEVMKNLSDEAKKVTGFTEEKLIKIIEKRKVVTRYKEDKIESYKITEDSVASTIDKDKFRQYSLDTFFVSTKTTDSDGNQKSISSAEKKKAYEEIEAVLKKAENTKDWSKVIESKDSDKDKESKSSEPSVTYSAYDFIESESKFDEDTTKKIMSMKKNEISKILETEDGYYVVKMKDNNSMKRYETELENAVQSAQNSKFEEEYNKMLEKHTIKVNENEWKKVELGTITLS
ncbi:peptidyl-prolyl cis-trans isomerase [Velocimicrobium porci]|uniref:PpiC domain-containing protein n=1 Tax=Velocimicrobium porci TaxID=2606634 RepID=A0A6L5Y168_9FIRM|nr:peptidyl-prolyl cis-trans isomerase [Velocimicrobium porci]MSS64441.1 hypothetical protein [Velocimicrobium porci]